MRPSALSLVPRKLDFDKTLVYTNRVYVSEEDFAVLCAQPCEGPAYVEVNGCVFTIDRHTGVGPRAIGLSEFQRRHARIGLLQPVYVSQFVPPPAFDLALCRVEVDLVKPNASRDSPSVELKVETLQNLFHRMFREQVLATGLELPLDYEGTTLKLVVGTLMPMDLGMTSGVQSSGASGACAAGVLGAHTKLAFQPAASASGRVRMDDGGTATQSIFCSDFDFDELGIGGLSKEFADIFRRAFAARCLPQRVIQGMGLDHVKGMLLYGPPGTGKTLVARQLSKCLNAAEPKIVNGPEVMSKYVGQSEENVRNLFADAEREQEQYGESSRLHVIVLDEMDAMCKRRGSSGDSTGALDGVVNQFLAKIDGVKALSNVFLIGMTNRKDMIDPALLRPGRLELLVEIGLPDEAGRAHILDIHTAKMRENGYLGSDVSTKTIAARARNFSGAELSGLVRAAQSYAVSREIDVRDPTRSRDGAVEGIRVCVADFDRALTEMKPAFGFDGERLDACIEHGIVPYSEEFDVMLRKCSGFVEQVQSATNGTSMLTLLLAGETGCGKSALAAYLARESGYPFVRRLSGAEFVGDSETAKTAKIVQAFEDAGKTPLSFLILDDLERLLDYVDIGPRFSNIVLQTLFNLLRKRANADHRMIVVGTTSDAVFMKQTGLRKAFSAALTVPLPRSSAHFAAVLRERTDFCPTEFPELCTRLVGRRVGVRTLLEVADMAAQQETSIRVDTYLDFLQDVMGEEGSVIDAM